MRKDEIRRRSRWIIRAMEWDDARARYPNIWYEGMPRHLLVLERAASRLRLKDLVVVFYPASSRHPERSERYLGISRVVALRPAGVPDHYWIDLETAHAFHPPLQLADTPRRVFLCCDSGWPEDEVALFDQVFDAAVDAGWEPTEVERKGPADTEVDLSASEKAPVEAAAAAAEEPQPPAPPFVASPGTRMFAGADYSGDMRDPRAGTWLALVGLSDDRLKVIRLEATGRSGLQTYLRDPGRELMHAEAIGLGFPFGLPDSFAEVLLGGPYPDEGWWGLARRMERLTKPQYLTAVHDFRDSQGEVKRLTDDVVSTFSPLHRDRPDMGSKTYHGIRMIAEDRSRYAIRPFETAQGQLLLEVSPLGLLQRIGFPTGAEGGTPVRGKIVSALAGLDRWPLDVEGKPRQQCVNSQDALDAVIAARCAAVAVLTAEVDRSPQELAPDHADRVRREGWIYGLTEPA